LFFLNETEYSIRAQKGKWTEKDPLSKIWTAGQYCLYFGQKGRFA
jgi:hypothetical protein